MSKRELLWQLNIDLEEHRSVPLFSAKDRNEALEKALVILEEKGLKDLPEDLWFIDCASGTTFDNFGE